MIMIVNISVSTQNTGAYAAALAALVAERFVFTVKDTDSFV